MAIDLGDMPKGTPPTPQQQAQIRSSIGLGSSGSAGFSSLVLTGQSITGTAANSLLDMTTTWNTSGIPSAIKLNVNDVASNAASNLLDLQVGGSSKFKVDKVGLLKVGGIGFSNSYGIITEGGISVGSGATFIAGSQLNVYNGGLNICSLNTGGIQTTNVGAITWGSGTSISTPDLFIVRDTTATLAQRNLGNAQTFRVYNSTDATPATNFDRATFGWTSNVLRIGTEIGGTYTTARAIDFVVGGTARWNISTTGTLSTTSSSFNIGTGNQVIAISPYGIDAVGNSLSRANSVLLTNSTASASAVNTARIDSPSAGLVEIRSADDTAYANLGANAIILGDAFAIKGIATSGWIEIGNKANVLTPSTSKIAFWESILGLVQLANNGSFSWSSLSHAANGNGDLALFRDATGTLAQRNGLNAQTFRIYNTYTDATTFERLNLKWDTNVLKLGTEKGSVGGAARDLVLETDATERLRVLSTGNTLIKDSLELNTLTPLFADVKPVLTLYRNGSGGDGSSILWKRDGGQEIADIRCYSTASAPSLSINLRYNYIATGSLATFAQSGAATGYINFGLPNGIISATANIYNSAYAQNTIGLVLGNMSSGANSNIDIRFHNVTNEVHAAIRGVYTGTAKIGGLSFLTANGSTLVEALRVTEYGYIGIGTNTPSSILTVSGLNISDAAMPGSDYLRGILKVQSSDSWAIDKGGSIAFSGPITTGTQQQVFGGIAGRKENITDGNARGYVAIYASGTGSYEKMRIDSNGNVGIGNIAPAAKLDVVDIYMSGSGSLAGSALNLAQTWNTTGTPTAIKLNVTDTASNASSNLLDLQVGGASRFKVTKNGGAIVDSLDKPSGQLLINSSSVAGVTIYGNTRIQAGSINFNAVTYLHSDAANTLDQRNAANAQTFRLYNTYTDATTFERLNLKWDTNVLKLGTEKGSVGGAARDLVLETDATERLRVLSTGNVGIGTSTPTQKLQVNGSFSIYPNSSNSESRLITRSIHADGRWALDIRSSTAGGDVQALVIYQNFLGIGSGEFSPAISSAIGISGNIAHIPKLRIAGNSTGPNNASGLVIGSSNSTEWLQGASYPDGSNYYEIRTNLSSPAQLGGMVVVPTRAPLNIDAKYLSFLTGNTTGVEAMRITGAGGIGIGTTNPLAKLDIAETWNASAIAVTGASGDLTTATLTFTAQATAIPVGSTIVVASINPAGYNGTFVVTASTTTSVSYANATTAAWVSGGTIQQLFTSVKVNITDTASNAGSKLLDLQTGGVSLFAVRKDGAIAGSLTNTIFGGGLGNLFSGRIHVSDYNFSVGSPSLVQIAIETDGSDAAQALVLNSTAGVWWSSLASASTVGQLRLSADLALRRDATAILAQRNLGTAQTFRVYNSTDATPATNFDRATFGWTSNVLKIGTEMGGSYTTARYLELLVGGVTKVTISPAWVTFGDAVFADKTITIKGSGTTTAKAITVSNNASAERFSIQDNGIINHTLSAATYYAVNQRNTNIVGWLGNGSTYFMNFDTLNGRVSFGDIQTPTERVEVSGNIRASNLIISPAASVTPPNNGDLTFQATSNTSVTLKLRGSDGVVRSASLTLA